MHSSALSFWSVMHITVIFWVAHKLLASGAKISLLFCFFVPKAHLQNCTLFNLKGSYIAYINNK